MKNIFFLLTLIIAFAAVSCTKEDQQPHSQPHDENAVMLCLHQMITGTDTIAGSVIKCMMREKARKKQRNKIAL